MGFAGDGDLTLLHDLEQGALNLGRRTVDFVGQQQIGEDRPERGTEFTGLLAVDARADQVCRHQVGRELDSSEMALNRGGKCLDCEGLC